MTLAHGVLAALAKNDGRSTGKLHGELCGNGVVDRDAFEQLLSAMARAGLLELKEETFRAEGREIAFRKVLLIKSADDFELLIKERPEKTAPARSEADLPTVEALKKWRMGVAKKEGVPAFRVLTDKALYEIAQERPGSNEELLLVAGVGPRGASRYGAGILHVLSGNRRG